MKASELKVGQLFDLEGARFLCVCPSGCEVQIVTDLGAVEYISSITDVKPLPLGVDWDYQPPKEYDLSQYRPFANAAEFEPHRDRWLRRLNPDDDDAKFVRISHYDDSGADDLWWHAKFDLYVFDDNGEPFGVPK